jgi:hypothetical protein
MKSLIFFSLVFTLMAFTYDQEKKRVELQATINEAIE